MTNTDYQRFCIGDKVWVIKDSGKLFPCTISKEKVQIFSLRQLHHQTDQAEKIRSSNIEVIFSNIHSGTTTLADCFHSREEAEATCLLRDKQ
jgi:hypothetical protein